MFGSPTRQVSKVTTRPAPIRGLNSFDSIVGMPDGFALVLRNLYAQPYGCQVRKGFRRHVTGLSGNVESVCSHNISAPRLYAFSGVTSNNDVSMYDVTEPGQSAVTKLTGLVNARWQHINFPNAAGVHMVAVNGANNMIWVQPNSVVVTVPLGDGSGNTISGVDPKKLVHVYAHQKRIWFVEKDSSRGWYLPPDQIVGAAKLFDFGGVWTRGGALSQIITWTIDDGNGADDHLMAISTQGEISVYAGLDVEGADSWALQGVYFAGAPIGRRAAVRKGGDVLIMTQFGGVYMSDLLKSTKVNPTQDNDFKYIQNLLAVAIRLTGGGFGWQPFVFPGGNMTLINFPATESTSLQFAMNDITKAWSQFDGYNSYCWELHNQLAFYGSFGAVYRAWEGTTDDSFLDPVTGVITPGDDITWEAQTSFTYFEMLGVQKHYKMVRPTIISRGAFSINFSVNTDFIFDSPLTPASFAVKSIANWVKNAHPKPFLPHEGVWNLSTWEGGLSTYKSWQAVTGIGTAASIRMVGRSAQETYWATTDWVYEPGGIM